MGEEIHDVKTKTREDSAMNEIGKFLTDAAPPTPVSTPSP